MKSKLPVCVAACAAWMLGALALVSPALADPILLDSYGFTVITSNNPVNGPIGSSQLGVDVMAESWEATQVTFVFHNYGPVASSITGVYFDDGTLLDISQIVNGPGVLFSEGGNPGDLPAGNNADPDFVVTQGFLATSDGAMANGVNPGEWLKVTFDLKKTDADVQQTASDTLAALVDGTLRIGIHVQAFADNGKSESFVSDPLVPAPPLVPLPAPVWAGLALFAGIGLKRKFSKH